MALNFDILELARHLKQERLFVNIERESLQRLNEDVKKVAEDLYHESWLAKQQRDCLGNLVGTALEAKPPAQCCANVNQLNAVSFTDSYRHLSHHDTQYGEFLKAFRESPQMIAYCINECDRIRPEISAKLLAILMSSVCGNCVMQEDELLILQVIKHLFMLQVANHSDPRKLLRKGKCSFIRLLKQLFDTLFSSKLFLTAALHDPVMRLLMEDEWFYDIDPDKALVRFPASERLKRFGQTGTAEYQPKLDNYRKFIEDKLVSLATRFIQSIKNNMHCFPSSLSWIISLVYDTLSKNMKIGSEEARAVCADLVISTFICPAICDPEPHGITSDIPISHIARHNLMQMAQIIQVLAISRWEEIDPKLHHLYRRYEQGCMSNILDTMLNSPCRDLPSSNSSTVQRLTRTAVLLTHTHLNNLITYLRSLLPHLDDSMPEKKQLEEWVYSVPQNIVPSVSQSNTPTSTPPDTPIFTHKRLRGSVRKKLLSPHSGEELQSQSSEEAGGDNELSGGSNHPEDVLVISLGQNLECPGMLSEQKVLSMEQESRRRRVTYHSVLSYDIDTGMEIQEKRTRFSQSHDQESIGNASDIQEAISEAASSHSVGSVDLENDNDNFSDMLSANVSGRGTPNVSGRDTPLSQAESVEEPDEDGEEIRRAPDLPITAQKSNREDVTERFGKFEIKAELEKDECKSTVSETWSTDVLASDSEPPETNTLDRLDEVTEEIVRQNFLKEPASEISETASDAWSTDVLASDTEEKQSEILTDFDQDDVASVGSRSTQADDNSVPEVKEDTPLGSGGQSPNTDLTLDDLDAARGRTPMDVIFRNQRLFPRHTTSDPTEYKSTDDIILLREERANVERTVSDIVSTFNSINSDKLFIPRQRESAGIQAAQGKVSSVLSALGESTSLPNVCEQTNEHAVSNDVSWSVTTSGDSLLSSDTVIRREGFTDTAAASDDCVVPTAAVIVNHDDEDYDSSLEADSREMLTFPVKTAFECPIDTLSHGDSPEIKSLHRPIVTFSQFSQIDSSMTDSEFGDDDGKDRLDNLKLSEQQNTKLDAKRFSNNLSMFDPLNDDQSHGADLLEGPGTVNSQVHIDAFKQNEKRTSLPSSFLPRASDISQTRMSLSEIAPNSVNSRTTLNSVSNGVAVSHNVLSDPQATTTYKSTKSLLVMPGGAATDIAQFHDEVDNLSNSSRRDSSESSHSANSGSLNELIQDQDVGSGSILKSYRSVDSRDQLDGDDRQEKWKKGSFFNKMKERLNKGMKRRGRPDKDDDMDGLGAAMGKDEPNIIVTETSDDILDKYRKKPVPLTNSFTENTLIRKDKAFLPKDPADEPLFYDPTNLENCHAFTDAKRKLRLVLSTGEFEPSVLTAEFSSLTYSIRRDSSSENSTRQDNDLVRLLRMQLAEAINLQNKDLIAQLHEAIRCVRMFDNDGCKKLLKALQHEYKNRSAFIAYLVKCRQGLLTTHSHLQRLYSRVKRDREICHKHFTNVCVRMFVESREKSVLRFMSEFQKLTMADEKTDLVENFLQYMYQLMAKDPMWQVVSESQIEDSHLSLERLIMSRVYTHAIFPNGDGDIYRDQILQQHIKQLSQMITPMHKDLMIPRTFHHECPWPAAQREIYMINAYKTPKDKLQCVLRCSTTIMNLLSLASEKSVPAADDFMPVLIYVLIKANPSCLLSTIQYVNSFYETRLSGEEQYWWTQFMSAVEFIKTMDYTEQL